MTKIALPSRRPRPPDAGTMYRTTSGFSGGAEVNFWSPRIGDRVRGDNPRVRYLFGVGGAHLFAPDGASVGRDSSTDDARRAAAEIEHRFEAGSHNDRSAELREVHKIPIERQRVCTQTIFNGMARLCDPGTILDQDHPLVVKYPESFFQPAAG